MASLLESVKEKEANHVLYDKKKKLEKYKIRLTKKNDFNLIDAFNIFDIDGKGKVRMDELYEVLT